MAVGNCLRALAPLERGVDLRKAFDDPVWHNYVGGIYTIACQSTWADRLKPGPTGQPIGDRLQVYRDTRAVVERFFADRPTVDRVPTLESLSSRNEREVRVPRLSRWATP